MGDVVDHLDNVEPPENPLQQLIRLRKDVDRLIQAIQAQETAEPSSPPPRQVGQGLLQNPYVGLVDDVRKKSLPARKGGGTVLLYEILTGAAPFSTFDRETAKNAWHAHLDACQVQIKWVGRVSGRFTNYDITSLRVLPPHGQ
jgi:hypothetical protein